MTENKKIEETEVFKKKWFAWVMLIVGGILLGATAGIGWIMIPIFFYLIWKYKHHGRKMRIVITVFFSFVLLGAIASYGEEETVVEEEIEEVIEEVIEEIEEVVVEETEEEKAEREAEEKAQAEKEAEEKSKKQPSKSRSPMSTRLL